MGYDSKRYKVHCFACQADYDLFDLLMLDNHLASSGEALALAREKWGRPDRRPPAPAASHSVSVPRKQDQAPQPTPSLPEDHAAYIARCAADAGKTNYFTQRGLSPETVSRFSLGYDQERECVVLPCEKSRVVRREVGEKRYLNEKGQPSPLFQPELLTACGEDTPVFLAEGTFDALSAEELGFRCAGMNGAGNREKIAALLRTLPGPVPIALVPDNDEAGNAWAEALTAEFPWLYRCDPVPVGKDLNESLTADRTPPPHSCGPRRMPAWRTCPLRTKPSAQPDRWMRWTPTLSVRPSARPCPRAFPPWTRLWTAAFTMGYMCWAPSVPWVRPPFACRWRTPWPRQRRDVLVFSLEMTAFELDGPVPSSRESFLSDTSRGRTLAKTVRASWTDGRYRFYTPQEQAHLAAAKDTYAAYGNHLWFREGDHETGLAYISGEIARHIAQTGVTPVVLIDYLQIIAPVDVHFTDKQNLDRIVCALKKLSRTYSLTILAISSFNRENYNLEVSMSAFKESGGIDYSADVLLGLQARGAGSRSFNLDEEKRKDPRELELKILKNRSAALGDPVPFRYYPAFSCFQEG